MGKGCAAIAAAAFVTFASSAFAGDRDFGPVYEDKMYDWTGFFVEANVGRAHGDVTAPRAAHLLSAANYDTEDTIFGAGAGYRYQFENDIVLGVGVSAPLGSFGGSAQDLTLGNGATYKAEVESAYLVRFMGGVAIDRWLPYFVYGFGSAEVKATTTFPGGVVTSKNDHYLEAIAFGLNYALWHDLYFGVSYQMVRASQEDHTQPAINGGVFNNDFGFESEAIYFTAGYTF